MGLQGGQATFAASPRRRPRAPAADPALRKLRKAFRGANARRDRPQGQKWVFRLVCFHSRSFLFPHHTA